MDKASARAEATRSVALARSQASLWTRTTTLENTRQRLLGQYEATWQASLAGRQSLATAALAQATGSGWAAFQAGYAAARSVGWTALAVEYAGSIGQSNGLSTAYQSAVSAARVHHRAEVSARADVAFADAATEAQLARRTATATAGKLYAEEVADARKTYRVTVAQDARASSAAAAAFTASAQAAASGYDNGIAAAASGYRAALSTGQTAWRAGRAAADLAYRQTEAQQYRQWTLGTAAVDEAFRRLAADGESALTSELATTSDSPWADFEADRAAAGGDWTEAVAPADRARRTAVAEAVFTYDVARAATDAARVRAGWSAAAPSAAKPTSPPAVPPLAALPEVDAAELDSWTPPAAGYSSPADYAWTDNRAAVPPPAPGAMAASWWHGGYGYGYGWYGYYGGLSTGSYGSYLWDAGIWFNADHMAANVLGSYASVTAPPAALPADDDVTADDELFATPDDDIRPATPEADPQSAKTAETFSVDLSRYSVKDMESLVGEGFAVRSSDGHFVAVVGVVGMNAEYFLFRRRQPTETDFVPSPWGGFSVTRNVGCEEYQLVYVGLVATAGDGGRVESTGETLADLVQRVRNAKSVDLWAQLHLGRLKLAEGESRTQAWETASEVMTTVARMLPVSSTIEYVKEGSYGEAGISLAGDVAMFLTGPAAAAAKGQGALRLSKTLTGATVALEGGAAVTRLGQGVYELSVKDGDNWRAAGYLGEGVLRMLGMTVKLKSIKAAAPSAARGAMPAWAKEA